ncbi:efflux RND transporter permease subunit [Thiolinea disciformis]|uniref:efflux RND transporter permease subunit n=1 Tax=Thiolinea disciformis TaxID=125614 RepID=UPI00035EB454|nr:multidrug efflux RND transporter permease subunit [Thiolinea disciformis]
MFSRFFIDRPIFAIVISIFIALAGFAALRVLPIAQYPQIAPPTVRVTATYPGASAQVIAETVAAPIENAINGVENMLYMSSTSSSSGAVTISITFEIGTDTDKAAINVNNRIKQVEARLPDEVRRQGITVIKGSSSLLQILAFYSEDERYDDLFISNYLSLSVLDRLKLVPGTSEVQIFGAKDYAMRIWLKLDQMAQLGLSAGDVASALTEQNAQFAAGKIGQAPTGEDQQVVYTITTQGRLSTVEQFENIILRANADGSLLRLKDIARVELGSKNYDFRGRINGKAAAMIGISLQNGANALEVADSIQATMKELSTRFPEGLTYNVSSDNTRFVRVSIREVVKTLGEAIALVFLVVFVFLQNWRATLIPILAVPVSLLGTFAGLMVLGYSINTLTLFGMVLSIGIVVDDAIVVLENVERIMHEEGLSPRAAAIKAMQEVSGPVVAIVLVLVSVFVPVAFLGGLTGELYRQFAVTISISVTISGIVALTLTPALCSLILRPEHKRENILARGFNKSFGAITKAYVTGVGTMLRYWILPVGLFASMLFATTWLWKHTPTSLVPDEDQGYFMASVYLPDGSSLERTDRVVKQVVAAIKSNPANVNVVSLTGLDFIGGGSKNNAATFFVAQSHWDERTMTTKELVAELLKKTSGIKEAMVLAFTPPAILGLGSTGGFEFYIQNRGDGGSRALIEALQSFQKSATGNLALAQVRSLWKSATPQLYIDVNRERAKALGISLNGTFATLAAGLGTYYVNDFNKFGRSWQVLMSADMQYRRTPDDVKRMFIRSSSGNMVPLSTFATVEYTSGPETIERFNNLPAVKVMGSAAAGYSSGQALNAVQTIADQALSSDFSLDWSGAAFQEKRSSSSPILALSMAVIMVFLILAALYERWTLPFSVMLALPFGLFGALAAIYWVGMTNDVYFQIGLVTLLGLAAKNAILIVEYALYKVEEGWKATAAAMEAARLRFRPIIMTSLAFILGVLPLALSVGAGAGARRSVGTGVTGGMLAATFLAIFFVPFFFKLLIDRRLRTRPADFQPPVEVLAPSELPQLTSSDKANA